MTIAKLQKLIDDMSSHITFAYAGFPCGIDPISQSRFDLWCGDRVISVCSRAEIMSAAIFNGKTLPEIVNDLQDIEP